MNNKSNFIVRRNGKTFCPHCAKEIKIKSSVSLSIV